MPQPDFAMPKACNVASRKSTQFFLPLWIGFLKGLFPLFCLSTIHLLRKRVFVSINEYEQIRICHNQTLPCQKHVMSVRWGASFKGLLGGILCPELQTFWPVPRIDWLWQVYYLIYSSVISVPGDYATRLQGDMGTLLINLPNLGYDLPLQKINHKGNCFWSLAVSAVKLQPNQKKKQMFSYPY